MRNLLQLFQSQKRQASPADALEITNERERRKIFLRYVNNAWLLFGLVTLAAMPIFPEKHSEFTFLILTIFPTYLITSLIHRFGKIQLAEIIFTLSVNFSFYGLFITLAHKLGAAEAFHSQASIWMLMGLAVLFAGALIGKWAAPGLALINTILLIGTRLTLAPDSDPRPSVLVFWWMMALTIWLYERTLGQALERVLDELAERKRAERIVNLQSAALEAAANGIVITDRAGIIQWANAAFTTLTGFTKEEAVGKNPRELIRSGKQDRAFYDNMWKTILAGQVWHGELINRRKDGTYYTEEMTLTPLKDERGEVTRFIGIKQDVSTRKQAEETLRDAENKYRSLVEHLSQVIYTSELGNHGTWIYVSPQIEKLLGYTPQEWLADPTLWYQHVHPQDRDKQLSLEIDANARSAPFESEYRILTRAGNWIWVRDSGHIFPSQNGSRPIVQGALIDISERKQAEETIQTMNILLERTLEQSPVPMVLVSMPDGIIRSANSACMRFLGIDDEPSAIGRPLSELKISWQDFDIQGKPGAYDELPLPRSLMGLKTEPQERHIVRKDGTSVYGLVYGSPIFDAAGNLIAGYLVMIDITERKLAEDALATSEAELRALFHSMQDVVLVIDRHGVYRKIAPTNPELLYKPSQEMLGQNLWEIFPAKQADTFNNVIQQVLETRETARIEYELPIGNQPLWFSATISPMDADGTLWVVRDITERKHAEQMQTALYQIANMAQGTLSLNDLFASIHEALGNFMPAENFYIAIYDGENDLLSFPYFVDEYDQAPLPQKPGNGLTEYILRTRQPLLATPQVFDEMIDNKQVDSVGIQCIDWMGVPLTVGDETFGVMVVQTYADKIRLAQKDLELLTFVSTQAAMVIKRKQAEQALHQRTSQLEALRAIGLELTAELDADKLLHSITAHALELLHSTGGGIYLYRPGQDKIEWVVANGTQITPLGTMLERGEGLSGKVWEQRKPMIVSDYEHWEGRAAQYEGKPFKAVMGVPIIKGDEFLGVLVLLADDPRSFNMQGASMLELFAGYAAVAIHNARLYQNASQRLTELEVLYKTSNALSTEHDLTTLLRSIVENTRKLFNTATSGMYLTIPGSDELELSMDTTPYVPIGTRIRLGEGVAGRVAQTRQPMRIDDYSKWEGRSAMYEGAPIRAVIEVPMLYRGELIGVLTADEAGESERKFTEEDERLLSLFASQAAGAIQSARLFEETRRRAEEFISLYETTHDLAEQQDLSTVLSIITKRAATLLDVPNAALILYDPARGDLEIAANIGPDLPIGTRRKLGDGLAGRVAQFHEPVIVNDYQHWEHRSLLYAEIPYTAMMGVPLLYGGSLLGVLDVSDIAPSTRTFNEADVRLLSLFAGQAASAIANARLFQETVRRLENLQSLRTIDNAISGSADVSLILEVILNQVISQLGADAAVILLFNPAEQILEYAAGKGFRTQALQYTRLKLGQGYAGRVVQEHRTKHIPDIRSFNTDFLRSPTLSQEGFVSYYGVPLITKGEIKGVLEVFHRTPFEAESEWLNFLETLAGQTAIALDNTELYKGLQHSNTELTLAYDATIEGWSRALDLRDKETEGHTKRVTEITMKLAKTMGIGDDELLNIRRGALLHDIGKMGVPDSILLKPGDLTKEEWDVMRKHPVYAYEMLTPITYLKAALDIPYSHHEKWDGTGYPNKLKGEEIPLAARIFAVVDVWDAIRSDRPYRQGWNTEKAVEYIKSQSGTHFDPKVVDAFLGLLSE